MFYTGQGIQPAGTEQSEVAHMRATGGGQAPPLPTALATAPGGGLLERHPVLVLGGLALVMLLVGQGAFKGMGKP